jgi:CRISPR-associated RAMP protein (TIGR02581 family)
MLKQLVNECVITLDILPQGPILVKSGIPTLSGPDMAFVRVWRNGQEEVYLPGSSLKGVLRSHAERITRTLKETAACDPFAKCGRWMFCGHAFEKIKAKQERLNPQLKEHQLPDPEREPDKLNQKIYAASCPICRLFGSTWYAGRLATADAYVVGDAPRPQIRDGVGIDRFTGGSAYRAKFDLEVITEGRFRTTLHLRNFELWQLGLVAFLLQDLKDGLLRVGSGKSRGLGKFIGEIQHVALYYLGLKLPDAEEGKLPLCGVGSLVNEEFAQGYKIQTPDRVEPDPAAPQDMAFDPGLGLRAHYHFPGDSFPWTAVAPSWVTYMKGYETHPRLAAVRQVFAKAKKEDA